VRPWRIAAYRNRAGREPVSSAPHWHPSGIADTKSPDVRPDRLPHRKPQCGRGFRRLSEAVVREKVTVARGPVAAGSEAQIDYGRLGTWFDPVSGRRVAVWAFVTVLAHSRHLFVQPVIRMDQSSWCASHVAAFEFFDGVPARLVPDNLKTGVTRPDLYDPKIHKAYAELGAHYGCLIDPARAGKPKDKPQVERPMQYVRDSFWRGREFDSLEQMQADAEVWSREVAGVRKSRAIDGQQPGFVFATVEQHALLPLPRNAFQLAAWSTGNVTTDCAAPREC
jgi:transposase